MWAIKKTNISEILREPGIGLCQELYGKAKTPDPERQMHEIVWWKKNHYT